MTHYGTHCTGVMRVRRVGTRYIYAQGLVPVSGQGSNIKTVGLSARRKALQCRPLLQHLHTQHLHTRIVCALQTNRFGFYMDAGLRALASLSLASLSLASLSPFHRMRVEFLLKTDSVYPKDTAKGAALFTLATPGNALGHTSRGTQAAAFREPAEDVNGLMFLNVGVQDSKSDIVDASAKVMPHMTCNIIVEEDK